jgi:hypothetical protein
MLENIEEVIKNGQSRETSNIRYTRGRKTERKTQRNIRSAGQNSEDTDVSKNSNGKNTHDDKHERVDCVAWFYMKKLQTFSTLGEKK